MLKNINDTIKGIDLEISKCDYLLDCLTNEDYSNINILEIMYLIDVLGINTIKETLNKQITELNDLKLIELKNLNKQ